MLLVCLYVCLCVCVCQRCCHLLPHRPIQPHCEGSKRRDIICFPIVRDGEASLSVPSVSAFSLSAVRFNFHASHHFCAPRRRVLPLCDTFALCCTLLLRFYQAPSSLRKPILSRPADSDSRHQVCSIANSSSLLLLLRQQQPEERTKK